MRAPQEARAPRGASARWLAGTQPLEGPARERRGALEGVGRIVLGEVDVARESRTGFTNPFGKLGKPINGLTLPVEVEEQLRKRAAHAGIPFLELVRELIVIAERGRDVVEGTLRARLDAIEGKQQE